MNDPTLHQVITQHESQTFDRKSIRIAPKDLAVIMVAFANADGGTIAIGIADDGKLEGIDFVGTQIREHTYLGPDARFVTKAEYPEFVWKELIINAITHRDYSILGTDIQIKMFDDRITVESPGNLPSIVRLDNMRHVHFSRNPLIAQFLKAHKFVREFGEGVDRMYRESAEAGNPEPKYEQMAFMILGTAYSLLYSTERKDIEKQNSPEEKTVEKILSLVKDNPQITQAELSTLTGLSRRGVEWNIQQLKKNGLLSRVGPDKGGYWQVNEN